MRKLITYLLLILLPLGSIAQIAEVRTYGGLFQDEGRQIIEIADGYVMVGSTSSTDNGNSDVAVIAINEDLSLNWNITLGDIGADQGISICEQFGGGYLVLGNTNAGEFGGYDMVVYAIDESGVLEWVKYYGTEDWDLGAKIVRGTASYFIAGTTYGNAPGGSDQLLLRINGNGDVIDSTNFDILPNAEMGDITFYEGFIYAVGTRTYENGSPQGVVRKLSANGALIWEDVRDSTSFSGNAIAASQFGIVAVYEMTDVTQNNTLDVFVVNFDSISGEEEWSFWSNTADAGNQQARSIIWGNDEAIVTAKTDLYGAGGLGAFVERYYFDGGWYLGGTIFGGSEDDEPYSIIKDSAGRVLILGKTASYGNESDDFYLVRTPNEDITNDYSLEIEDFDQIIVTHTSELEREIDLAPYPNPSSTEIQLPPRFETTNWTLFNAGGAEVKSGVGTTIHVSNLSSGVYFLKWGDSKGFTVSKVIVE